MSEVLNNKLKKPVAAILAAAAFAGLAAEGAKASQKSESDTPSANLVAKSSERSISPSSLLVETDKKMDGLTSRVESMYASHNSHIKMTPYTETLPNGDVVTLDYYVTSIPKGHKTDVTGKTFKVYDKFVVAAVKGGEKKYRNLYQIAYGAVALPKSINPAWDPFSLSSEFMQMGSFSSPSTLIGLNVTTGPDKAKYKVYSVDSGQGGQLTSVDLRSGNTPTVNSVNTQSVASQFKHFEDQASKILDEAQ